MKLVAEYLLISMLLIFLFIRGVQPAWKEIHSDFANYYVSAKLVVRGESLDKLYNNEWFQEEIKGYGINTLGKFSPFPPITAWMMIPFTVFSPLQAQRIFTIINLIFLGLGIQMLKQLTGWRTRHCVLFVLGGGLSLVNNVAFGQVYWIMTVFILLSIILYQKNQALLAGALLAAFSALKYFPLAFIFGFVLIALMENPINSKSHRNGFHSATAIRLVASYFLFLIFLILLQYSFFGGAVIQEFFTSAFLPHLDGQLSGQGLYSFQFQSWDNFFRNLYIADPKFNPRPFIPWLAGKTVSKIAVVIFILGLMAFTLNKYKNAMPGMRTAVFLSLPSLAALVILPVSATYHFVLLVAPLSLLLREAFLGKRTMIVVLTLYFMIGFIPYGYAFRFADSWGLLFAYPRLWLVTGLFLATIVGLLYQRLMQFQK